MDPDTQPGQQGRALACRAAREFNIPVQLAEILQKRGFDTLEALRDFLHPQLAMLPAPDTMKVSVQWPSSGSEENAATSNAAAGASSSTLQPRNDSHIRTASANRMPSSPTAIGYCF